MTDANQNPNAGETSQIDFAAAVGNIATLDLEACQKLIDKISDKVTRDNLKTVDKRTTQVLLALAVHPSVDVRRALAANGPALAACPDATLKLAEDAFWNVRRDLAANGPALAACQAATLKLAEDDVYVRRALAVNGPGLAACPEATLKLAEDKDVYVRRALAANGPALAACPAAIGILRLTKDGTVEENLRNNVDVQRMIQTTENTIYAELGLQDPALG